MKTKRKMSSMERREERTGFLFLLPSFIGFAVFILIPVVWGLVLSLFDYNGFKTPTFVGLGNFVKLFQDQYFYISLKNNLFYMVVSVFFTLLFGLILAVFLNHSSALMWPLRKPHTSWSCSQMSRTRKS